MGMGTVATPDAPMANPVLNHGHVILPDDVSTAKLRTERVHD
jgi:hypothetical protein